MSVEYLDEGFLFCGHFVGWDARDQALATVAEAVASRLRLGSGVIERILRFELEAARHSLA